MMNNFKKYITILIFVLALTLVIPVNAKTNNNKLVNIYFFHSKDCSHCKAEIKFLDTIEAKYDNVNIYRYEIHEQNNNELRKQIQELYNIKTEGVPLTIIGDTPYSGYSEEKSNKTFIKTIEYYSKYGYIDKAGQLLELETPSTKIDTTAPTLRDFIKEYGNYKLIGNLYTDDLDTSINAIILGILSQLNIINIISLIVMLLIIGKLEKNQDKLSFLITYLILLCILNTTYIIQNQIYTLIIEIFILILLMFNLLKYKKNKLNKHLSFNLTIIVAIINCYLENYFYKTNLNIFKELIILNSLSEINKITYYGNYLFSILLINTIIVIIPYYINKKISSSIL